MAPNERRPKIAILGSGVGAMTAAYELAVQDKYDITVYQMGWRLGGQGASGRNLDNLDDAARIEEHGLHVWFGFYHNAFSVMRRCYADLGRPSTAPLATAETAFVGQDAFVFREVYDGTARPWKITFPSDPNVFPGGPDAEGLPPMHHVVSSLLENAFGYFATGLADHMPVVPSSHPLLSRVLAHVRFALNEAGHALAADVGRAMFDEGRKLLEDAMERIGAEDRAFDALIALLKALRLAIKDLAYPFRSFDTPRRVWMQIDLLLTIAIGMLDEGIVAKGFDVINKYDFREWLRDQGADPLVVDGPLIQALYDIFFAYEGGDTKRSNVEAGNALRGSLRTILTYQGHVLWKMRAGMGDTVFAPLYLALRQRGVTFKFFHRVTRLHYDETRGVIGSIELARQVRLAVPEYAPLVDVKGLPCWPSAPLVTTIVDGKPVTQIENGEALKGVDLESMWSGWVDQGEPLTLAEGTHFDHVVLGITVGGLPFICDEKLLALAPWATMLDAVKTVRTQAVQLWFNRTSEFPAVAAPPPGGPMSPPGLGFPVPGGIIAGCTEPDACWADFTQVLGSEVQPPDVRALFYGCGVLEDDGVEYPPATDHGFPAAQLTIVKQTTLDFLRGSADQIWPAAVNGHTLDWTALTAPAAAIGEARLDSQYLRANLDPSERYVLSLKGTSQHRLRPGGSGVKNLFLVGSWTDNGFNLSCVEAATMSGMEASRAISGVPQEVFGEHGFPKVSV